jgi:hypothetical protein
MTICTGFIALVIAPEAGPVYAVFMAGLRGHGLDAFQLVRLTGSYCLALAICFLAATVPVKMGEKSLRE